MIEQNIDQLAVLKSEILNDRNRMINFTSYEKRYKKYLNKTEREIRERFGREEEVKGRLLKRLENIEKKTKLSRRIAREVYDINNVYNIEPHADKLCVQIVKLIKLDEYLINYLE